MKKRLKCERNCLISRLNGLKTEQAYLFKKNLNGKMMRKCKYHIPSIKIRGGQIISPSGIISQSLQHNRKLSHFFRLIDSYKSRRKKTLRNLMKQTASFNPFPHRPTEEEIEKRITAEDELRLKYITKDEQDQTTIDEP